MNGEMFAQYDRTRDLSKKAVRSLCYAPFGNLYFDYAGRVRVCCHNSTYVLGNAQRDSIDEMWRGAKLKLLRDALVDYQFGPGCQFCENQTKGGWFTNASMRRFDEFHVPSPAPEWPQQMEFSISNACNLECVMCRGEHSSAIRAHREKKPPMPRLYSDEFLDSLQPYLPHLRRAKFLGGEPFLVVEYFRLWDSMIAAGLATPCHITTNGTQYNSRIERIMEALPMSFAVSLDGATKETVESIRVNANYDEQLLILKRFRDYTRERGTDLSLTFCFMRQNWHEFGDYCLFGDEWKCTVGVNTVLNPPEFGVYTLPPEELRKVYKGMEAQAARLDSLLKRNRGVWFAEFDRVRVKCEEQERAAGGAQAPVLAGHATEGVLLREIRPVAPQASAK
ncbi:MAG: radical SAM protein [Bryobacteraceae bacterium]